MEQFHDNRGEIEGTGPVPSETDPDPYGERTQDMRCRPVPVLQVPQVLPETPIGRSLHPILEELRLAEKDLRSLLTFLSSLPAALGNFTVCAEEFTREDLLYLLANQSGHLLRPALRHYYYAERLERSLEARDENEEAFKRLIIDYVKRTAWERTGQIARDTWPQIPANFAISEDDGRFVIEEAVRLAARCPLYALGSLVKTEAAGYELGAHMRDLVTAEFESLTKSFESCGLCSPFITDPGHGFGVTSAIFPLKHAVEVSRGCGRDLYDKLDILKGSVSCLLCEDDPTEAQWTRTIEGYERIRPFAFRKHDYASHIPVIRSADEAIASLVNAAQQRRSLPDVILTDIELSEGRSGPTGLDVCEEVHYLCKEQEIRHPCILVYSSNLDPYRKSLERMIAAGIVFRAWEKQSFTPGQFVDALVDFFPHKRRVTRFLERLHRLHR